MRKAHYLKDNKSGRKPERLFVFDTETRETRRDGDEVHHGLWFGYGVFLRRHRGNRWTPEEWHRFTTPEDFRAILDRLTTNNHPLTLYAHNLQFDLAATGLVDGLLGDGWKLTTAVIESPPTFLTWRKGKRTIKAVCTLNFFPMPLKAVGQALGIEKLPMPAADAEQETWEVYGRRDTEILVAAVKAWYGLLEQWDLGTAGISLPSQAFRAFRHRFMHEKILIDAHPVALDVARKGYYGGRVECFRIGEYHEPFYKLDINSMYPYVMRVYPYPVRLRTVWTRVTQDVLRSLLEAYCVCARVSMRTTEPTYPYRTSARLLFPVGRFDTYLTSPELTYALDHNHIETIHTVAIYDRAAIFTEYIDFFYQKRLEAKASGNEMMNLMCKLFLNSFYGKFGQMGRVFRNVESNAESAHRVWFEIDAETGRKYYYRQIGNLIQTVEGETEASDSHPAIAAHVTAYARMYLWQLLTIAGLNHVAYCDTDSIFCTSEGFDRLRSYLDASALGRLKLEGQASVLRISGPKDYQFGAEQKAKGIRKDALWLDSSTLKQIHFRSLKSLLQHGDVSHPQMVYVTKKIDRTYRKGHVLSSGLTRPYDLPGDSGLLS